MSMNTVAPIPEAVRIALEQVLGYAMPDEAEHYAGLPAEERSGHIYESLLAVRHWLDRGQSDGLDMSAVCDLLAEEGYIAAIWSIEDVLTLRPDLTHEQCWQVLDKCQREQDAGIGINWHVIEDAADELFPTRGE